MTSKIREFHRPTEAAEAAALLQRPGVRTAPLAVSPRVDDAPLAAVEAVVDLAGLGLNTYSETEEGVIHLGAGVTLQQLVDSVLLQSLAGGIVAEGALLAAGSGMRHAATLGGALRYAQQAAAGAVRDGPPELLVALLVLDAQLVVERGAQGREVVGLAEFLAAGSDTPALLVEVRFTRPGAAAHAAVARVARTPRDQGILAAAALIDGATVRLAVAPGGTAPLRLPAIEASLAGQALTDARLAAAAEAVQAAVAPVSDFRGSAEYRRAMSGVLLRRALAAAASGGR